MRRVRVTGGKVPLNEGLQRPAEQAMWELGCMFPDGNQQGQSLNLLMVHEGYCVISKLNFPELQ